MVMIKKSSFRVICCFPMIFLFIFISNCYAIDLSSEEKEYLHTQGTIVFVSQTLYPPFEFIDANRQHEGMMLDVVRWMAVEMGFKPVFMDMTFQQAQEAVLSGKADILTSLFYSDKRKERFEFTESLFDVPASIFVRAERTDIKDLKDLNGKTIAIQRGDYAKDFLESQKIRFNILDTENFAEATDMVIAGKADAVIGDEQIVLYHIFSNRLTNDIKIMGKPLYIGRNCMASNKGNAILLGILNKGIREARKSGVLDKISTKWLGTTFGPQKSFLERYLWQLSLVAVGLLLLSVWVWVWVWVWNLRLRTLVRKKTEVIVHREEALLESENKFKSFAEQALAGIYLIQDGVFKYVNPRFAQMFGYTVEECLKDMPFKNLVYSEDLTKVEEQVRKRISGEVAFVHYTFRGLKKNGQIFHVEIYGSVIVHKGRLAAIGTILDITERKRAQEALQESETRYRLLAENAMDVIWTVGTDMRLTYISPSVTRLLGFTPEEAMARTMEQAYTPAAFEQAMQLFGEEMALESAGHGDPNRSRMLEFELVCKNGDIVPVEGNFRFLRDTSGRALGILAIVRDITERKRAEEELRRTNKLVDMIVENIPNMIFLKDSRELQFVRLNKAGENLLGYSRDELLGKNDYDFFPKEQADFFTAKDREVLRGKEVVDIPEESLLTRNKGMRTLYTKKVPLLDANGEPEYLLGISEDITERKRAEAELEKSLSLLHATLESTADGLLVVDRQGRITSYNQKFAQMWGIPESVLGMGEDDRALAFALEQIKAPDDFLVKVQELYGAPEAESYDRIEFKDGRIFERFSQPQRLGDAVVGRVWSFRDVTIRVQTEAALRRAKEEWELTFDAVPEFIMILDENHQILRVNRPMAEALQSDPESLIGKPCYEAVHQTNAPTLFCPHTKTLADGLIHTVEVQEMGLDLLVTTSPLADNDGHIIGSVHMARDITEPKRAEQELRDTRERLELALQGAELGTWDWNVQTGEVIFNDRWAEMLGYTLEEIDPHVRSWEKLVHPDDLLRVMEVLNSHLEGKTPFYETEYRLRHKTGEWVWILDKGKVIERDPQGKPVRACGTHLDNTARKRMQEALRESENNFRTFFESMTDMIIVCTLDGRILFSNSAYSQTLGYSAEELAAMYVPDLHPAEDRQEAMEIFAAILRGERENCPLPLGRRDGGIVPVETRIWFGRWNGQECIFGISKNLTAEVEAQQRFERLFRSNPNPMAVTSLPNQSFEDVNDAFLKVLGYSRDDIIGKTAVDLGLFVHPEQHTSAGKKLLAEGRLADCELQVRRKDGAILYGLFSGEVISSQVRQYFLTVMVDITERKHLEERMKASLAEKEVLLREIHHRVKNNLQIVVGILNMQYRVVKDHLVKDMLQDCQTRIRSMALVHETLHHSGNLAQINLHEYLRSLGNTIMHSYGSGRRIKLLSEIEPIQTDIEIAIPCGLIFNELLSNALKHAFPDDRAGEVLLSVRKNAEDEIVLTIKDNGVGIPADTDLSLANSLGLSLVIDLAQFQLGGKVVLNRDHGTEFQIIFKEIHTDKGHK